MYFTWGCQNFCTTHLIFLAPAQNYSSLRDFGHQTPSACPTLFKVGGKGMNYVGTIALMYEVRDFMRPSRGDRERKGAGEDLWPPRIPGFFHSLLDVHQKSGTGHMQHTQRTGLRPRKEQEDTAGLQHGALLRVKQNI